MLFIGGRDGKLYIWDIENPASTAGVIQDNTPMTALDTPHTDNLRVFGFNPYYMMFVTGSDELVSIGSPSLSLSLSSKQRLLFPDTPKEYGDVGLCRSKIPFPFTYPLS